MDTVDDMLAAQPFLAGLSPEQMRKLTPWSRTVTFPTGARIFEEGRRADRFWLIRQGRVALETQVPGRGAVVVEDLGRGAVLGWSWLFPPYRWHFSASAVEVTTAIEFDGAAVRELCQREPALGFDLVLRFTEVVVDRLQSTRLRLLDLYEGRS
jgi:CRP/FNR family transcriptional regulator, cyclic AMP receptor protein